MGACCCSSSNVSSSQVAPTTKSRGALKKEYKLLKKKLKRAKRKGDKRAVLELEKRMDLVKSQFKKTQKKKGKRTTDKIASEASLRQRRIDELRRQGKDEIADKLMNDLRLIDTADPARLDATESSSMNALEQIDNIDIGEGHKIKDESCEEVDEKTLSGEDFIASPVRYSTRRRNEEKSESSRFEILLDSANKRLEHTFVPVSSKQNAINDGRSSLQLRLLDPRISNMSECRRILRDAFPTVDPSKELLAVTVPTPISDYFSLEDNRIVYVSPEARSLGMRSADMLLMVNATFVGGARDVDVASVLHREEASGASGGGVDLIFIR